jgi:hypothetical protein
MRGEAFPAQAFRLSLGDDFRFPRSRPDRSAAAFPLETVNFTGCAYGDGTVEPFSSPNDCPICNGFWF